MNNRVIERLHLQSNRFLSSAAWSIVPSYVAAIACAEVIAAFFDPVASVVCHALLLSILLSHYVLAERAAYRPILPALALLSLLRILSLTIPITDLPSIYWPVLIGVPLLVAVALTIRLLGLSPASLGLVLPVPGPQITIAFSGLPLGFVGALILQPKPLVSEFNVNGVIIGAVILTIFSGFTEEIIFRGLLHRAAAELYGRRAIIVSAALFAIMYLGSLSWGYVVFIGLVGLFFGWCVQRTRCLWGVILAHSLLNIGIGLVWPFVIPRLGKNSVFQSIVAIPTIVWLFCAGYAIALLFWLLWYPRLASFITRSRRNSTALRSGGSAGDEGGVFQATAVRAGQPRITIPIEITGAPSDPTERLSRQRLAGDGEAATPNHHDIEQLIERVSVRYAEKLEMVIIELAQQYDHGRTASKE